jgi:hypothetical protein
VAPPIWYFIPEGVKPPAHLRVGQAASRTNPGKGPAGMTGLCVGGAFDEATKGTYTRTADGWWFRFDGGALTQARLEQLLRLRGESYREVERDGLTWRVPRLLNADFTTQAHLITSFGTLDAEGAPRMHEVVRHEDLQDRLVRFWRGQRFADDAEANNLAVLRLACEVIGLWYHVSVFELFAAGVVTWGWADLVLSTCCDLAVDPNRLLRQPEAR